MQDCERAKAIFETGGINALVAICQQGCANNLEELGRYEEALSAYNAALDVLEPYDTATFSFSYVVRLCRARVLAELGLRQKAFADYELAEGMARDSLDIASVRLNRAILLKRLGRYTEALVACDQAEETFMEETRTIDIARCSLTRAGRWTRWAESSRPEENTKAANLYASRGLDVKAALCWMQHAEMLLELRRYTEAEAMSGTVARIFEQHGKVVDQAAACLSRLKHSSGWRGRIRRSGLPSGPWRSSTAAE